jgi:hypothetical protein
MQVYFDNVPGMENQVILNPQWIIDSITYIVRDIQLHRFGRDRKAMELQGGAAWKNLVHRGILTESLLNCLWIDRREHRDFLLRLMRELGLFAKLPVRTDTGELRYFVPSTVSAVIARSLDSAHMSDPSADPEQCIVGFDFKPFLPNGFFERVVNRLVSDWPAGYVEIDPQISWNAAELCVSGPKYRVKLIVDKEAHTISVVVGNEHAKLIIPHVKDVADKVNRDFYAGRIIFVCSVDAEGGAERILRQSPGSGSQETLASAVSSCVTRLETDPDFRDLRAFFEKSGVASGDAIEYAKAGRGEREMSGETVASLRTIHAAWTKSWDPHQWKDGGEAEFRAELAEYFGVAVESSRKAKRNQNLIIDRLAGMGRPPEIRDFLIGYFGGDNLHHAERERKHITGVLMRENLRAELSDLVTVQDLHSGLSVCTPSANYRVLHLAMHGHQLTRAGKHTLAFSDDQPPEPELLAKVIASSCIHDDGDVSRGCISCVFINACFGSDIGERLKSDEHKVPWVVTWTTMVDDEAAQTFADEFYAALSKNPSDFCIAFERAKTSLCLRNWLIDDDGGDPGLEGRHLLHERQRNENNIQLKPAGIPILYAPIQSQQSTRTRNLGKLADAVPKEKCQWAGFISHHQAAASRTVQLLKEWIEKDLKERRCPLWKVWVDKQERATPDGMNEGVRLSRNFILFLTKDVLTREWCLNEIRNALKHRKNVVLVYETNENCGGVSGTFATFYGPELKKAFPHSDDYDWLVNRNSYVAFQDRGQHVDVMLCDAKCKNGILDQMELEEAVKSHISPSI